MQTINVTRYSGIRTDKKGFEYTCDCHYVENGQKKWLKGTTPDEVVNELLGKGYTAPKNEIAKFLSFSFAGIRKETISRRNGMPTFHSTYFIVRILIINQVQYH